MIIKRWLVNTTRFVLRMHSILHLFEAIAAFGEGAYITFSIVVFTGLAQVLAAWLLPDEHIHIGVSMKTKSHAHKKRHKH